MSISRRTWRRHARSGQEEASRSSSQVDAGAVRRDGHTFLLSANGVWLNGIVVATDLLGKILMLLSLRYCTGMGLNERWRDAESRGSTPPGEEKRPRSPTSTKTEVETEGQDFDREGVETRARQTASKRMKKVLTTSATSGRSGTGTTSTSSQPTPALARTPSHPRSRPSSPGWNISATANLPSLSCGTRSSGLGSTTLSRWTSA